MEKNSLTKFILDGYILIPKPWEHREDILEQILRSSTL